MKDRDEIYKKIEEWDEKIDNACPAFLWTSYDSRTRNDQEVQEYILGVIDALLWVIGDNSGKTI
ncbi:MAG: hypothetical protein IIZ78_19155 [Clostridiales bacterium]|nr:hypothetical protein [Clostridiales bacterium]